MWTIELNAQFVCGFTSGVESNFTPDSPNTICIPSGVLQGRDVNPNYIPFQGDDRDVITIELVFHTFAQSEANPLNFTEDDRYFFHEIVEVMNGNIFGEINCPNFNTNGVCVCDAAHCEIEGGVNDCCVQDSKIRFTLADEDIYFWTDPLGWDNSGPGVNVSGCPNTDSYVYDQYAKDIDCKMNVFFINDIIGYSGCGPAYFGEHQNMVLMNDTYLTYLAFANLDPQAYSDGRQQVVTTFTHEVGHCFGLHHAGRNDQSGPGVGLFPDLYDYHNMLRADNCNPSEFNCSNNIMESAVIRNWFSNDQIAHMRRLHIGSWRSKQARVDYDQNYSIDITGDEEWGFGRVNRGDITVKAGAKLTISCKVLMAGNSTIIVEKGGKLVVDGGHITMGQHKCGDYWKGIRIEGDLAASQFLAANQGRVNLKNGALIEYAEIAIDVDGGGGLYARDSRINNCELGVQFAPYQNFLPASGRPHRNLSSFNNCAFSVDEDYTRPELEPMVKMVGVDGIGFRDCVFEDLRTSISTVLASKGIHSFNANFSVSGGETNFNKIHIGIDAGVSGSSRKFSVKEATFDACYVGVISRAVNSFTIKDNIFEIGAYDLHPTFLNGVGVSVASGTNFKLSGNTFNGAINSATIGIIAGDTGEANNHIERNDFAALSVGNYAVGNNINLTNPFVGGLEYLCNKNTDDNRFDFYVLGEGIGIYQGSEDKSAGNTFNLNNNPAGSDFLNSNSGGWPVSYWYFDGDVFQDPINTIGVFKQTADINTCGKGKEDDFIKEEEYADYEYKFQQEKDAFLNFRNVYEGHVNNGDTEELKSQVEAVTTVTKPSVLAALQSTSPYLSMEILKLCADQSAFTANNIKNIALLNPELLRNENVVQYIVAEAGLNATQESELRTAAETQTTERKTLESDMAASYGRMQEAGRKMIISLLSDTIGLDTLALHNRLSEQLDITSLYQDVELYWQQADYTNAFDLMNNEIDTRVNTIPQMAYDLTGFNNLKELHWKVLLENRSWNTLSEDEITALKDIADGWENYAGNQAQHILNYYYGQDYLNIPALPDGTTALQIWNTSNQVAIDQKAAAKNKLVTITVSPNPANNNTWFNYSLPNGVSDAVFRVYNISGKTLFEQKLIEKQSRILWQIPDKIAGVVFYSIEWSKNRTNPEKLVIIR